MSARTAYQLVDAGTPPTFSAATASDTMPINSGTNTFAVYRNGSGSSVTVTVVVPGNTTYGQPTPDPALTVAAAGELWIPLRKEFDDGTGNATLTTSSQTSVTMAVVKVG